MTKNYARQERWSSLTSSNRLKLKKYQLDPRNPSFPTIKSAFIEKIKLKVH